MCEITVINTVYVTQCISKVKLSYAVVTSNPQLYLRLPTTEVYSSPVHLAIRNELCPLSSLFWDPG